MVITPQSYIKLVRFDVTKENQITFPDGVAQVDYFRNVLLGTIATDFTYIRQDEKIRIPYIIDEIENYNYLIVQNLPYNYKYYFYYITNMEYVNDNMTDVYIKLDVFQTYQFNFLYNRSFVEREHVNSDNVGEHTIPEGLETGEYVVNTYNYYDEFDDTVLVVTSDKRVDETSQSVADDRPPVSYLNGIMSYGAVYLCEDYLQLAGLLFCFSHNEYSGGTDSITSMYFVPRSCINWDCATPKIIGDASFYSYTTRTADAPMIYNFSTTKPTTIDGYTPKNKKLLTFPYCFMVASNNNGSSNVYQYEKFKSNNCVFDFSCIPTPRSFY
ncbi:MAG: hypothetical protein IKB83_00085 [Mycoplasmataceae bacterium]|nr:hypothetical protein [bacterium]MBR2848894.1 hypothetical protein [Mycoplasmataceae bacterium]